MIKLIVISILLMWYRTNVFEYFVCILVLFLLGLQFEIYIGNENVTNVY